MSWMKSGEEGKLLPRAAGFFNHPGEAARVKKPGNFVMNSLFMLKGTRLAVTGPSIPLSSHQGEREKNEYLYDGKNTAELPKSMEIKL